MGGVDMERPLGVGLTPPTLNHQEKPPDTQIRWCGRGTGATPPPIPSVPSMFTSLEVKVLYPT